MIEFRKKGNIQDLMPEAMARLDKEGIPYNIITPKEADKTSKINSKAMVLVSFIKNEGGHFQIQIQDKELYNYTIKLIKDYFRMRILNIDQKTRVITAECNYLGIALDIIEILGSKYTLSIVR